MRQREETLGLRAEMRKASQLSDSPVLVKYRDLNFQRMSLPGVIAQSDGLGLPRRDCSNIGVYDR
jgi:hypothetical protein